MNWVGYVILLVYIAIAFWAVLMGMDKMAKVIIGNYLAGVTAFFFGNLINQRVKWLLIQPSLTFLGISYEKYANFLSAGQLTFVLLLFCGLIWLIYVFGRIQVSFNTNITTEKLYFILLIPLTILSFIIGPYIALKADGIQIIGLVEKTLIQNFGFLVPLINNIPLLMFLNGVIFIFISSQINFKISLSAKATKIPEGI